MTRRRKFMRRELGAALGVLLILGSVQAGAAVGRGSTPGVVPAAAADAAGAITLKVRSANSVNSGPGFVHKGDPVTDYKWLINRDDTGDPGTAADPGLSRCLPSTAPGGSSDPQYADTCQWPSTRVTSGMAPIVAQGNQSDLNAGKALNDLPPGKYLISVTADGFKIDGKHFTVSAGGTTSVQVDMDPTPLPLTTLRIEVFNDNMPVDATYEVDAEAGLAGFTAHLTDVLGTVSTDYYGNALCTKYMHRVGATLYADAQRPNAPIAFDADNKPIVDPASTGRCTSDSRGQITIPNLGPNRFAATVTPPAPVAGQTYQWVQTTTLEGGHDHDIWSQEGATGFDTEQTKGAELVPSVQFGFVKTQSIAVPRTNVPTGEIKGVAIAGLPYVGGQNGQVVPETGFAGAKSGGPIKQPWIALSDLDAGDAQVYVGRGNVNGSFDIKNVPDGTYQLSIWDDDQDYILWSFNVEVSGGGVTDVGNKMIVGWFTHVYGKVFIDSNGNGKLDPGEKAVPQFGLTVRERDNSLMDQATNTATTDVNGFYDIRETYPLGKWLVLEAFNTRYRTTGITYKGENETKATTQLGSLVDLNFLPIIGLGGEIDWGVEPYDTGMNGGIVGTVTYDTTRNELDPADAATEPYQPGIPGVPVDLYVPKACTAAAADVANECRQGYQIVPLRIQDPNDASATIVNPDPGRGEFVKGPKVQDTYTSEEWAPPRGCTARMYNGQPLTDQQALPQFGAAANTLCVEAPMMGVAVGPSDSTPGNIAQTVNGNYGFATSKLNLYPPGNAKNPAPGHDLPLYADLAANGYDEEDLPAIDYIVSVDIPKDPVDGRPMYKVTSEADVNVFDGDSYLPQQNYPPTTVAAANDPAGPPDATPLPPTQPPSQQAGIISPCVGALHKVAVTDAAFLAAGGSPFEGQDRPYCTDKLVTVRTGQSTAPNFNLFTDVPIPTHFWGLTLNDLGLTLDKRSVNYGEAQGLPFVPVGLYDWSGRLVDTTHTDFNGLYEALEPSTDTFNCPVPAGPCPNMYRFVGNDPGQPGALNADYNPRFRTIATNFQGWPGLFTVTDEAPTQVASTALAPDTTVANPTMCDLGGDVPQLLAVDRPYVRKNTPGDSRTVTVTGFGFGANTDTSTNTLKLNGIDVTKANILSWSDGQIAFVVPAGTASGAAVVSITNSSGRTSVNSLTIQVLDKSTTSTPGTTATNPRLVEVGPGKAFTSVQRALEAARPTTATKFYLVVVWPATPTTDNPQGEYNENLIVHHQVHLQGVGPGGFRPDGSFVPGSILDGSGFNADNASGLNWVGLLGSLTYSGNPAVPDAAVVTVLDDPAGPALPNSYPVTIDGFTITGGAQSDLPVNVNEISGGIKTPYGAAGALITQGGGVYLHNNVRNLQLTDNIIRGNGGSYGGGVRVGTPYVGSNRNYNLLLARNQIRDNGGTNLAGGIGLFSGSDGYQITGNAICGNFSAEYGGAISAFGYNSNAGGSSGGAITKNRIWFNSSYDEGGGIMVAGELPRTSTTLSEGSGPVTIDGNVIAANLASDDGGGIRLLQTSGSHISRTNPETINITNNTVVNNVSAHEGGGIALDDAAFVNIVNNTVAKNLTTATAVTSDGTPAPAGLSTAANSDPLQARLRTFTNAATLGATTYSKPTLLNDVFWDNRAGSFAGGWVYGIGGKLPDGSDNSVNNWDMGVTDVTGTLTPTRSVLQDGTDVTADPSNSFVDPGFASGYDVTVNILASRTYPAFRQAVIVAELLPPSLMGDYHLAPVVAPATPSSARGLGAASTVVRWGPGVNAWTYVVSAPSADIDGDTRPTQTGAAARYDAGSDQMSP
ncbi:IPT/TIG domain-containing protein [Nakamurella panacisegetis]|uniref:IPT/TIG domain-containing protein n=1 Tax=Nakamurella panacisegetis TaxID=1090615 RepID=A0A1H0SZD4_9ACTN|nr:IPT/TIG domain-containing protein [Nakamurella panacisegetis]SDP46706.1 IPT/TIG domain-containing protein [Nakamurella panacisegetis]